MAYTNFFGSSYWKEKLRSVRVYNVYVRISQKRRVVFFLPNGGLCG